MKPFLFLVSAVAASSGLAGGLRWALRARSGDWSEHGDGVLFWLGWANDPGGNRLLAAGLLALVLLVPWGLLRGRPGRLARILRLPVDVGGHPACAVSCVLLALLPQVVAPLARPDASDHPKVVFVLLDSVRLDSIGWGGAELPVSPRLDALAQGGCSFTQAITQAPWTKPSVATLHTGLVPSKHLAVGRPSLGMYSNLEYHHRSLAEAFAAAGYDTCGLSTNPNISFKFGFDQGFFTFKDDAALDAEWILDEARGWLDRRGDERPYFLYLHFNDAHYPYAAPEPYRGRFYDGPSTAVLDGETEAAFRAVHADRPGAEFDAEDVRQFRLSQMEEIAYLDERVGGFLEDLLDAEEDLLVVIVSDHGEEFLDHGDVGHGHQVHDELIRVPLQFAWSESLGARLGLEPGRWNTQVRLMDVPATLLDLAGIASEAPPPTDGVSLGAFLRDEADPIAHRPAWSETDHFGSRRSGPTGPLRTFRTPEEKLILTDPWTVEAWRGRYWVFDLMADPEERENLAEDEARRARLLEEARASGWLLPKEEPIPYHLLSAQEADATDEILDQQGYVDAIPDPEEEPIFVPGAVPWVCD